MVSTQQYTGAMRYIAGKKRAEEALGFLGATAVALEEAPTREEGARAVVTLAVPILGAFCAIELTGAAPLSVTAGSAAPDVVELALAAEPVTVAEVRAERTGGATALACGLDYAGHRHGRLVVAREDDGTPLDGFDHALIAELARATALWLALQAVDRGLVAA